MTVMEKPTMVSGGCLCGSVRYTITFPADHDWDDCVGTCQCTWCRKITGSLMFRFHQLKKTDVKFNSDSTLRTYQAAPGKDRGFCNQCGSYMFFRRENSQFINLAVGCFDKDAMRQYGHLLTRSKCHLYICDEIPSVMDHLKGERFETEPSH